MSITVESAVHTKMAAATTKANPLFDCAHGLESSISGLHGDLARSTKRIAELTVLFRVSEDKVAETEKTVLARDKTIKRLESEIANELARSSALNSAIQGLEVSLERERSEKSALELQHAEKVREQEAAVQRLEREVATEKSLGHEMNASFQELESSLDQARRESGATLRTHQELRERLAEKSVAIETLQKQLTSERSCFHEMNESIRDLQSTCSALRADCAKGVRENNALADSVTVLQEKNANLRRIERASGPLDFCSHIGAVISKIRKDIDQFWRI